MASTNAKAIRKDEVLLRLSKSLGVEAADLHGDAKGDAELAHIMTLERLADALDARGTAKGESLADVEMQLEAETQHDVVMTGHNPPTFVETDKPAPKTKSK